MQSTNLPKHDIVLLGIGHTNAHVLNRWRMAAPADCRLTCISNFPIATYSGMLPGVLAGQYEPARMEIDLVRLCSAVGARLILGSAIGIDRVARRVQFDDRAGVSYDWLSIGIGSVSIGSELTEQAETGIVVPLKPMQTLLTRLSERLEVIQRAQSPPVRVAIVGAGAGGVEIAMCLEARLRKVLGKTPIQVTIVHASEQLIGGVSSRTARVAHNLLESRGVTVKLGCRVVRVSGKCLLLDNGEQLGSDLVLWSTSATASPVLSRLGLPTDQRGFLLTRSTLQSVSDDRIFAVGDAGTSVDYPTPKAGVFAVRQGPVLWENLCSAVKREPLHEYRPQQRFLKLFNLGNGEALGEYQGLTISGRWVWKWKDLVDSRFMSKYQNYQPAMMPRPAAQPAAIRCAGCGGKVGGSVLSRVLKRLDIPANEHVVLGLEAPDDAAILRLPPGSALNATVDFFSAPLDDPYSVGRIAALNSASDCFATGARPIGALAAITIPVGPPPQQEQLLFELLTGALHEFRAMGATLVGGHTIEGPQLTIGFTMLAEQIDPPRTKRRLRESDQLVLTKPLGSGFLLAALMQAKCSAAWYEPLLKTMLQSNAFAAELCDPAIAPGMTDITGFGLAGHLLEMLRASGMSAEIRLADIPLLPGVTELIGMGIESTLAPDNRTAESEIEVDERLRRAPPYVALFDPQTCGGLLLGVPSSHVSEVLQRLAEYSDVPAARIGQVVPLRNGQPRLICLD